MTFCTACGHRAGEGEKFCARCGTALPGGDSAPTARTPAYTQPSAPTRTVPPPMYTSRTQYSQSSDPRRRGSGQQSEYRPSRSQRNGTDQEDFLRNKTNAILAYFGPLVLIPILSAPDSRYARFHANQGLILLIACVAYSLVGALLNAIILAISWRLYFITTIIISVAAIVFTVLAVIGIINAAKGRMQELPFIGRFLLLR